MRLRTLSARHALWAGCIVLAFPLASMAMPPDGKGAPDGGCDRDMRGPPEPSMGGSFMEGRPPMGGPFMGGPMMGAPGPYLGEGPPPYLRGLDLSDEQQDKVFAILHAAAPALRDHAKAASKAREALHAQGHSSQFDGNGAATLAAALGKAQGDMALLRAHVDHDIFAVLTDAQRTQIADRERGRDPHHHGGPPEHGAPPGP